MSFRPTDDGNCFFGSPYREFKSVADDSLASNSSLYIISEVKLDNYNVKLEKSFPGKSESLYDKIFNGDDRWHHVSTIHLYKYCTFSKL